MGRASKRPRLDASHSSGAASIVVTANSASSSYSWSFSSASLWTHHQRELLLPTSVATKDIFLERFRQEILDRYQVSLASQLRLDKARRLREGLLGHHEDYPDSLTLLEQAKELRAALQRRLPVGAQSCTRILENAALGKGPRPLLLVLAASDDHDPMNDSATPPWLSHIPLLVHQGQIPLLCLPSPGSRELGQLLGIKRAGILAFMPHSRPSGERDACTKGSNGMPTAGGMADFHASMDSFVGFIREKFVER